MAKLNRVRVYPGEKHAFKHKQPYLGETTDVVADFLTSLGFATDAKATKPNDAVR
jgi:hypothetical protein